MKRCYHCHGPFGLIRHYYNRHQFCRPKCVAVYRAELQQMISEKKSRAATARAWALLNPLAERR